MTLTPGFSFIIRNFPGSFELTKDSCPLPQLPPCESTTYILKKALRYTLKHMQQMYLRAVFQSSKNQEVGVFVRKYLCLTKGMTEISSQQIYFFSVRCRDHFVY